MHRWVWDLRAAPAPPAAGGGGGGGGRRGGSSALPGNYTVILTVGGKTYTRQLTVKPDPRTQPGYAAKPYTGKGAEKEADKRRK